MKLLSIMSIGLVLFASCADHSARDGEEILIKEMPSKISGAQDRVKPLKDGYLFQQLSDELLSDFEAARGEKLYVHLVDRSGEMSTLSGDFQRRGEALYLKTQERFTLSENADIYLVFTSDDNLQSGECGGCTLTNSNLKFSSPNMCWCFTKFTSN